MRESLDCFVCYDVVATNGTHKVSFLENVDPNVSALKFLRIVGQTDSEVILRANQFSFREYRYFAWDGTRDGIVPLTTLSDLPSRAQIPARSQDKAFELDQYYLLQTSVGLVRAAKSEKFARMDAQNLQFDITPDSVAVSVSGQLIETYDVTGGQLLTIDASDFSQFIDLSVVGTLPINGIRFLVADGATIRINTQETANELHYMMLDDQFVMSLDGRPIYVEGANFAIEDSMATTNRQIRLTAADEFVEISTEGEQMVVTARGDGQVATLRFPRDGGPVQILPGFGSDQVVVTPAFRSGRTIEIIGNLHPSDIDEIEVPVSYSIASTENHLGRLVVTLTDGESQIRFDATGTPLRNHAQATDVNQDGRTTSLDALAVINALDESEFDRITTDPIDMFPDVNGDQQITARDALVIINFLSRRSALVPEAGHIDAAIRELSKEDIQSDDWDAIESQLATRLF